MPDLRLIIVWDDGDDALVDPQAPYWDARDVAARTLSYMTGIGTGIPIFAPMISAQLVIHFDWRAVFGFMSLVSAMLWLLLRHYVEESLSEKNLHAIRPIPMPCAARSIAAGHRPPARPMPVT